MWQYAALLLGLVFPHPLVLVPLLALTTLGIFAQWWYYRRRLVTPEQETIANHDLSVLDNYELEEVEAKDGSVPARSRSRYAAYVARCAKAEFGLLKRSEANRLMVTKFCRDVMRERNVRFTHISALLPLAVELTFVPTEADVLAAQLRGTHTFKRRQRDAETWSHTAYSGPLSRLLHRLGLVPVVRGLEFSKQ